MTQRPTPDIVLVQGYAAAALVVNVVARLKRTAAVMLVCSPVESYYECRRAAQHAGSPFRRRELLGLRALTRPNARLGRNSVVPSRFLRDVVADHGARGSVDIVPLYGVDIERFAPSADARTASTPKEREARVLW